MTVYGTKINSDIDFPLDLTHETEVRYEVELSSKVPSELKKPLLVVFLFIGHMDGKCIFIVIVNLTGVK